MSLVATRHFPREVSQYAVAVQNVALFNDEEKEHFLYIFRTFWRKLENNIQRGAQLNSGWYKVSDFFGLNGLSHSIVEQKSDVSGRYLGENGGDGAS